MKKMLALLLVLGVAQIANAGFLISVDGQVDPPDTSIELLAPSGTAIIDVHHTGGGVAPMTIALFADGPGTLTSANAVAWHTVTGGAVYNLEAGDLMAWQDGLAGMGFPGVTSVVQIELKDTVAPVDELPLGLVADLIDFHCDGLGDVTLGLMDLNTFEIYDTQVIHQVPEPITMTLLGLGGLALIRRRRA